MRKRIIIAIAAVAVLIVAVSILIVHNKGSDKDTVQNTNNEKAADSAGMAADNDGKDAETGLSDSVNPEASEYVIGFYDFEKKLIESKTVAAGSAVTPPGDIQVPYGYVFLGWDKPLDKVTGSERINADFEYIKDKDNVIMINSVGGNKGDKITFSVMLTGNVNISGCVADMIYDSDILKFVEFKNQDEMVECNKTEDGTLKFALVSGENIDADVDLLEVTFKLLSDKPAETLISFDNVQAVRFKDGKRESEGVSIYPVCGKIYTY